jgi:hypothetical protein
VESGHTVTYAVVPLPLRIHVVVVVVVVVVVAAVVACVEFVPVTMTRRDSLAFPNWYCS